jgi:hypothetical protein
MTLIFSVLSALMLGIILGVSFMMVMGTPGPTATETEADAGETTAATASATATASASATAAPKPKVDAAAQARAAKLIALRKKVKQTRSTAMDAQCRRNKKGFPKGYVFQGGQFKENEYVANASGCVALAKTSKAPWFCCKR